MVIAIVLVALALLAAHASVLGDWIVDDAGITFAYAGHLAAGHGLVSQPGLPPVEGYSNPLWTLITATFWATGLFSIVWTPKLLALLFDAAAFALIARDLAASASSRVVVALPLVLLAACSSFAIWTFSGLENALLAMLVAWLTYLTLASTRSTASPSVSLDRRAGFAAALVALTRPEGLVYLIVHPAIAAVVEWRRGPGAIGRLAVRSLHVATGFVPVFGAYLAFRLAWFGDWAPNTARAKQSPSLSSLIAPGKLGGLLDAAFGDAGWLVFAGMVAVIVLVVVRRRLEMRTVVLVAYTGVATALYQVLPNDWMSEFRFATPFFVLAFWTLAELLRVCGAHLPTTRWLRPVALTTGAVVVAQALALFTVRTATFAACPTVPLEEVRNLTSRGFNALAERLGRGPHSLLTPDLGGELLESRLRVYDLAGLCDKTIAGSLSSAGGTTRLHDYLFDEVKPTFVHVSGAFVRLSGLHADPRFTRDYEPLHEEWQGGSRANQIAMPWWGDYVRRDATGHDAATLADLRRLHRELGLAAWRVWEAPATRRPWPRSPRAVLALARWTQGQPIAEGCEPRSSR
jgi:hypothetical protein